MFNKQISILNPRPNPLQHSSLQMLFKGYLGTRKMCFKYTAEKPEERALCVHVLHVQNTWTHPPTPKMHTWDNKENKGKEQTGLTLEAELTKLVLKKPGEGDRTLPKADRKLLPRVICLLQGW